MSWRQEPEELVDITFDELVRQTSAAFLVSVEGRQAWVAKSKTDNARELERELELPLSKREIDTITVPRWLAVANDWCDPE
jgi:hypothetical protein